MGRKAPYPRMREFFLISDLSISGNLEQLFVFWFLWHKSPPPQAWQNIFLTTDLSISGNLEQLWFLWQKSPHPQDERKYFYFKSILFRQFPATLVFVAEKPPRPSKDEGKFFDIRSIPFQAISSNFGFCGRKAPPPRMRETVLISDLSISGNFQQLWFLWQKSPPSFFCLFITDQACITQVEYPRFPYYKSILRFLLSEYLL